MPFVVLFMSCMPSRHLLPCCTIHLLCLVAAFAVPCPHMPSWHLLCLVFVCCCGACCMSLRLILVCHCGVCCMSSCLIFVCHCAISCTSLHHSFIAPFLQAICCTSSWCLLPVVAPFPLHHSLCAVVMPFNLSCHSVCPIVTHVMPKMC